MTLTENNLNISPSNLIKGTNINAVGIMGLDIENTMKMCTKGLIKELLVKCCPRKQATTSLTVRKTAANWPVFVNMWQFSVLTKWNNDNDFFFLSTFTYSYYFISLSITRSLR